jgi:Subtilase family.
MAFEHLSLPFRLTGLYNSPYGSGPGKQQVINEPGEQTVNNKKNRAEHGANLKGKSSQITKEWEQEQIARKEEFLPELPSAVPLFLQIDPALFDPDSLRSFGIEVISEEEDGFVIGASADLNLSTLNDKIEKFIKEEGRYKDKAAQLWDIVTGKQWRLDRILSKPLLEKWGDIDEAEVLVVDIAIACHNHVPAYPARGDEEKVSDAEYEKKVAKWEEKWSKKIAERDGIAFQRQGELEEFLIGYGSNLLSGYVEASDSFSCRIEITGKGLKDLVLNYPYVFEVEEYDDLRQSLSLGEELKDLKQLDIMAPGADAPKVCVIDSGIQENHILLAPGINPDHSLNYVGADPEEVADKVGRGGHGTRVAGVVLYPEFPIKENPVQLTKWVQNVRVLDKDNSMPFNLYPPDLVKDIVEFYKEQYNTRIYNMSISSRAGYWTSRMSKWAESIDRRVWEQDILLVLPTGNLIKDTIQAKLNHGEGYADYILNPVSRIANPGQSLFALTVGSICKGEYEDDDVKSIGESDFPSAFTRSGMGIWDSIKPELVEYGGDYVIEKLGSHRMVSQRNETSLHLVRSTLDGGPATAIDGLGTSFTSPKIASILSDLESLFPEESTLLYKALLVQSARWPEKIFKKEPKLNYLRLYGYGLPDKERATSNHDHRITLVNSNSIVPKEADVYEVQLPEDLRKPGDSYDILVEITLTFKAEPRRTRAGFRSYLSGWVDWHSSFLGEGIESFKQRIISQKEVVSGTENINEEKIPWNIHSRANAGINGVKLNNSATQKDWVILKSNKLTESFCIGVVGHAGWEKNLKREIPYSIAVSFEAINKDIEIYERIQARNEVKVDIQI